MNTTTVTNATEYRDLPLAMLTESTTNPRRIFEENALKELAETIRSQGVLSPLLVRPQQAPVSGHGQDGRLHRPHLLSREGRCPCCQDSCR